LPAVHPIVAAGRSVLALRHVTRHEAVQERIEPLHDRLLEAFLDNVEAAVASGTYRVPGNRRRRAAGI